MRYKSSFLIKMLGVASILALAILPWLGKPTPITKAGQITSMNVSASDNTPAATATYTIVFTPATAITDASSVRLSFMAPPDSQYNVAAAELGANSSPVFTSITNRDIEHGGLEIAASALPASSLTIELTNLGNPSKEGMYGIDLETSQGFTKVDRGSAEVTIGTIAIQGTVTIPGGDPANGAYVEAQEKGNFEHRFGSPTNNSGTYGIGGLTAGTTYLLNVYLNPDPNDPNSNTKGLTAPDPVEITYQGTPIVHNFSLKPATKVVQGHLLYTDDTPIAQGRIMAMRTDGPGFANTETNENGEYTLNLSGGAWEIRPDTFSGPDQEPLDYAFSGPGKQVKFNRDDTVETKSNVDFQAVYANATITGRVNPKIDMAGIGAHNKGGFNADTGLNPNDGSFTLRVPAGTYEIELFSDPFRAGDKYAFPDMDPVTVSANETKNLGVIDLVKMDKVITATVKDSQTDTGLANFNVGCFKPHGGGFAMGITDGNGVATINVTSGDWGCMAMSGMGMEGGPEGPPPASLWRRFIAHAHAQTQEAQQKYVVMGGPQFVTAGDTPVTLTFTAVQANRTIAITTVDADGNTISAQGFVEARLVNSSLGNDFDKGGGLGQPIDPMMPGMAELKVPAGVYDLRMMVPPGSDYSPGDTVRVDVTSDNASANLVLLPNDATIEGTLYDEDGNVAKNVFAMISAVNDKGAFIPGDVDPATGTYSMRVPSSGGTLTMGYFVDPESGYFPQTSTGSVTPKANETQTFDITMKKATASITVTVKDPNGNLLKNVFVEANNKKTDRDAKMDNFFHFGNQTDNNGQVTLALPEGEYKVAAFLPKAMLLGNKWIPPKPNEIKLAKNATETTTLQFQNADVAISGKVTKSDGSAVANATISAYSENGEAINTQTDENGKYSLNVTAGEWHISASNDDVSSASQPEGYTSPDDILTTGTKKTITENLVVKKAATLPATTTNSFDTDNATVISLTQDGESIAEIKASANAFDVDGNGNNATITASATKELVQEKDNIPLGIGLTVSAQSSQGQAITSTTTQIPISLKVKRSEFTDKGLGTDDVGKKVSLSYYDSENDTWKPVEGSVAAVAKDANGDGDTTDADDWIEITGSTSHFTTFAVTAATDTTPPSAPTNITATSGDSQVKLSWTNPSDSDFAGIKIYRSTTSGTVGDLLTTISQTDTTSYQDTSLTNGTTYYYVVRAYDTSGNISVNTDQVSATPGSTLPATGFQSQANHSNTLLYLAFSALLVLIGMTFRRLKPQR